MHLRDFDSVTRRRKALEEELGEKFNNIGTFTLDEKLASTKHCENMIGAAQVPLGIAGPLQMAGEHAKGEVFIPLATTEAALVASLSRGCKALTLSGGAAAYACRAGQTRGPVFQVNSLQERKKLYDWIKKNRSLLQKAATETSSHIKLMDSFAQGVGHYLFVRFSFDTVDAMGMNMVTLATESMTRLIERETGATCLAVAGNFDIDKKPAWLNSIENRGFAVWSEAVIPQKVVSDVLKTTPQQLHEIWLAKCMIGSAMSGSLGFNAHYANVIAALFIATGQDPAHVVEGSMGITIAKVTKTGDLYFSIYLPAVLVGTVGGGTKLATQDEALRILGCQGVGKVERLAEIVGGAVLAGELSLLASISQGTLGRAHKALAR